MKRFRQIFIVIVVVFLSFSSLVYGATWTSSRRLTNNAGDSNSPAIAVNGSNIYVVWADDTPGNEEIYFKKSVNGGVTWTATKRLTNTGDYSTGPLIAVNGSNIYVAWSENMTASVEIFFKRSTDGGATWSKNKRLTYDADDNWLSSMAVDGSNIYLVWDDFFGSLEIFFKRSTDGGVTWSANKQLTSTAGASIVPDIAVNGSNIYVVWSEATQQTLDIYLKRSFDGGATWTANRRLTDTIDQSWVPRITVNGSNIYLAWYDRTPENWEIFFKRSFDGGATWTANRRLSNTAGMSHGAEIAVDGSNVYVVWVDDTPGNLELYFKKGIFD